MSPSEPRCDCCDSRQEHVLREVMAILRNDTYRHRVNNALSCIEDELARLAVERVEKTAGETAQDAGSEMGRGLPPVEARSGLSASTPSRPISEPTLDVDSTGRRGVDWTRWHSGKEPSGAGVNAEAEGPARGAARSGSGVEAPVVHHGASRRESLNAGAGVPKHDEGPDTRQASRSLGSVNRRGVKPGRLPVEPTSRDSTSNAGGDPCGRGAGKAGPESTSQSEVPMAPKIETVCIWCPNSEQRIAEAHALGRVVSHGICDACKAAHFPNRVRAIEPLSLDDAQFTAARVPLDEADAAIRRVREMFPNRDASGKRKE